MKTNTAILILITAIVLPLAAQAKPGNKDRRANDKCSCSCSRAVSTKPNSDLRGSASKNTPKNRMIHRMIRHFDKIDTDGNGQLSKEELRAARKNRSKNGRQRK